MANNPIKINEEQAILYTKTHSWKAEELDNVERNEIGYLAGASHEKLQRKLNTIFRSVEIEGKGKDRIYILKGERDLIDAKKAIEITIQHGYNGAEFNTKHWKEKGTLRAEGAKRLLLKLETIFDKVEQFNKGVDLRFQLGDEKEEIILDKRYIKRIRKTKPKVKKVDIPALSKEELNFIDKQKKEFLNNYFIKKVKRYGGDAKENQVCEVRYEPREPVARRIIFKAYNVHKITFNNDWSEFISVVISIVSDTVIKFGTTRRMKNFDWSTLNEDRSKSNLVLKKHITEMLKHGLADEGNIRQNIARTSVTVEENGEKVEKSAYVGLTTNSTDVIAKNDGEGEDTALIEFISDKNRYSGIGGRFYQPNHFLRFFLENKEDILTKGQLEFYETMPKYLHEEGDSYTLSYSQDKTQIYSTNQRNGRYRRINERVLEAYKKAFPNGDEITLLQMKKESDLQLLNELIDIAYNDDTADLSDLNTYISNWVNEQLNNDSNDVVSNLLHDELTAEELTHMNRSLHNGYPISNKLTYKIISLIENKIQQLEEFDTSKGDRAKSNSGWTKEDHQKYKDYLHRINNKEIKVYDLKTGNFIVTEEVKQEGRNYKVFRLNTYGMRYEVGELDVGID